MLSIATAMVKEGGLGEDISDLPVAISAPEWGNDEAISTGHYFAASGFYTIFNSNCPIDKSQQITDSLFKDLENFYGGKWDFETDSCKIAQKMLIHIDAKRKAMGIDKARDRVLYDMAMRRDLKK
jgi:carbon-monoxide dehydrogenase catalytic subunit